jgi:replicative DNA helicase
MNESSNNQQSGQQGGSGKGRRNAPNNESLSNFVFGKVQPQAVPLEEAVLGALMLDREALPMVMDILRPESFYLEATNTYTAQLSVCLNAQIPWIC